MPLVLQMKGRWLENLLATTLIITYSFQHFITTKVGDKKKKGEETQRRRLLALPKKELRVHPRGQRRDTPRLFHFP